MLEIARNPVTPGKSLLLSPTYAIDTQITTVMRDSIHPLSLKFYLTLKILENTKKNLGAIQIDQRVIQKHKQWNHSSRFPGNHFSFNTTPMPPTLLLLPPPQLPIRPVLAPSNGAADANVVFSSSSPAYFLLLFFHVLDCITSYVFLPSCPSERIYVSCGVGGWRAWFVCCVLSDAFFPRVRHSWRTQDGDRDGREGNKVPDRLVGRTWLSFSYHKPLWLPGGCFVLRSAWLFLWFLIIISLFIM